MPPVNISTTDCKKWMENKNKNPQTNRNISTNGPVYKKYEKICITGTKTKSKTKTSKTSKTSKTNNDNSDDKTSRKIFEIGGYTISFPEVMTPIQASEAIVDNTYQKSKMYKSIFAMLNKEPSKRSPFEKMVRKEVRKSGWEPIGDDYEMLGSKFTDYML